MSQLFVSLLATLTVGACGSSQTVEQIGGFADKICACTDVACAESVEAEYLAWWGDNQRARGSDGDRKDVELAMQRYATCHLKWSAPKDGTEAVKVPSVNLTPAPAKASPAAADTAAPAVQANVVPEAAQEAKKTQVTP